MRSVCRTKFARRSRNWPGFRSWAKSPTSLPARIPWSSATCGCRVWRKTLSRLRLLPPKRFGRSLDYAPFGAPLGMTSNKRAAVSRLFLFSALRFEGFAVHEGLVGAVPVGELGFARFPAQVDRTPFPDRREVE